jgi:hypothetical protein
MDIMPAVPDPQRNAGSILVSDRDLAAWMPSSPRGFAAWFDTLLVPFRTEFRKMARATIEKLPDQRIKTPLQMAIQILKRHRDMHFRTDVKLRPSSIILTTLAARAYGQQQDLLDTLYAVVRGMPTQIERDADGFPVVPNPTNPDENFAEKWREYPERMEAFGSWLAKVNRDVDQLLTLKGPRAPEFLTRILGEREVAGAVRAQAEAVSKAQQQQRLDATAAGGIAIVTRPSEAVRPVQRSTSYGGRP